MVIKKNSTIILSGIKSTSTVRLKNTDVPYTVDWETFAAKNFPPITFNNEN